MSYNDGFEATDQVGSPDWLGADVVALQSIWGTENKPIPTEAGSLGKIKENSAFSSGAFGAVEVVEGDHLEAMREITSENQSVDPITGISSGGEVDTSSSTETEHSSPLTESSGQSMQDSLSDLQDVTVIDAEVITADPLITSAPDSTSTINADVISTDIVDAGFTIQDNSDMLADPNKQCHRA